MSHMTDFYKVQQHTRRLLTFEDGLWDMLLGMMFLALALYPVTRAWLGPEWNIVLFLVLLGFLVSIQLLVRQHISSPRIGYARGTRSPRLRLLVGFTVFMVLLTLGMVVLTLLGPASKSNPSEVTANSAGRSYLVEFIVILVMGFIFSALGYFFGVDRMHAYGWMLGLANLASVYMEHKAGWTFMGPLALVAGIILVIGVARFARFLHKYPLPAEEA